MLNVALLSDLASHVLVHIPPAWRRDGQVQAVESMSEEGEMLIFRLELDKAALREVTREARATLHANGQDRNGWGNALEKADEELKVEPFVDVHVDEQGTILGLLYPPQERIGVTYYVEADRCQCEAFIGSLRPWRPRRARRRSGRVAIAPSCASLSVWPIAAALIPVRTQDSTSVVVAAASDAVALQGGYQGFPLPPVIGPPQPIERRTRRGKKRAT